MRIRRETIINLLDLLAFILVTPDLAGKERLDNLRQVLPALWTKLITYWSNAPPSPRDLAVLSLLDRHAIIIGLSAALAVACRDLFSEQHRKRDTVLLIAASTIVLNSIYPLWRATVGTPISQLLLLAGALLFASTRIGAAIFAQLGPTWAEEEAGTRLQREALDLAGAVNSSRQNVTGKPHSQDPAQIDTGSRVAEATRVLGDLVPAQSQQGVKARRRRKNRH